MTDVDSLRNDLRTCYEVLSAQGLSRANITRSYSTARALLQATGSKIEGLQERLQKSEVIPEEYVVPCHSMNTLSLSDHLTCHEIKAFRGLSIITHPSRTPARGTASSLTRSELHSLMSELLQISDLIEGGWR